MRYVFPEDQKMEEKRKKKVAFCIPTLQGGGAERVFLTLAEGFAEKGIDVDLVVFKKEGDFIKDVSPDVNVVDLEAKRIPLGLFPLIQYLRNEKPDSVISALPHVNVISVVARILARSRAKLIITEHNTFSQSKKNASRIKGVFATVLMKWFYKKADEIVAVSGGVADDLSESLKINRDKIRVIYNPIEIEAIQKRAKEKPDHHWFEEGYKIILGIGRLHKQKDFGTLIKAFAKLTDRKTRLIILGEGPEREQLQKMIDDLDLTERVNLHGFVDNPYSYLASADLFALSSVNEGFGNVLVEALACGTPVVSTNCPSGPREILESGKYGKLVPVGDSEQLAEAIATALKKPARKEDLQKRAENFAKEKATEQYLTLM